MTTLTEKVRDAWTAYCRKHGFRSGRPHNEYLAYAAGFAAGSAYAAGFVENTPPREPTRAMLDEGFTKVVTMSKRKMVLSDESLREQWQAMYDAAKAKGDGARPCPVCGAANSVCGH